MANSILTIDLKKHSEEIVNNLYDSSGGTTSEVKKVNGIGPNSVGNVILNLDNIPDSSTRDISKLKSDVSTLFTDKADKATTLAGYGITDGVKSVNAETPDASGNVTVRAFSSVPAVMDSYRSSTVEEYLIAFSQKVKPVQGSAYLAENISFSNLPKSFRDHSSYPNCELFIYVPVSANNYNNIVYNLEISTTNCFSEQWYGGSGKWIAMCQVENGVATMHMNWQGLLTCPQDASLIDGKHKYIPTDDAHGVSKYWLDKRLIEKADKATTLAGYGITDAVKSVNTETPDASGNVTVRTFLNLPESMDEFKNGTTVQFCQKFEEIVDPAGGNAYLGDGICFTDMPFQGNAEMIINVPSYGIYILEISSCNAFDDENSAGKWMTIYWGDMCMPWQGYMTCPKNTEGKYVPQKDSDGVSKYWLDNKLTDKVNKTTTIAEINLENNIGKQDLLNSILSANVTSNGTTHTLQEWIDLINPMLQTWQPVIPEE